MKRTLCSVAGFAAAFAALLSTFPGPASADLNNWIMLIRATDLDGYYTGGNLRIGWREGFTNGIDTTVLPVAEHNTHGPPPPGATVAVAEAFLTPDWLAVHDYRAPAAIDSSEKVYKIALYTDSYDENSFAIDTMKITLSASTFVSYPYAGDFSIIKARWRDGDQWFEKVFDSNDPLPTTGWSFTLPGKLTYSYENPDLIIVMGVPEPGSLLALLTGAGMTGVGIRRRRRGRRDNNS